MELLHLTDPERDQNAQSRRDGLLPTQTIQLLEERVATAMSAYNKELKDIQVRSVFYIAICTGFLPPPTL